MRNYKKYVNDLYHDQTVKRMHKYIQHGDVTTFDHCLRVSYESYRAADFLNRRFHMRLDAEAVARGAFLHDLYLYDWHVDHRPFKERINPMKNHGFTHPARALYNAEKNFSLTPLERDIIRNHMWPFTLFHVPHSRESFLVCMTDKYCALQETFSRGNATRKRGDKNGAKR